MQAASKEKAKKMKLYNEIISAHDKTQSNSNSEVLLNPGLNMLLLYCIQMTTTFNK